MGFIFAGLALVSFMCALFLVSLWREDNGTADVGYGIAFIVAISAAHLYAQASGIALVLSVLASIWGIRLATRIYRKNRGKPEDFRYRAWREAWGDWFLLRSFLQIYMLQGAIVFIVALPVLAVIALPQEGSLTFFLIGLFLWCIGFFFEVRGDAQLDRFLREPANKGRIMTQGFWRYTRHPNYFGESMMWWGIALAAASFTTLSYVVFVSPILITYLLLFVSGVPMLEKRWAGNPEWEAYKEKTSVFLPLPPG